MATDLLRVRRVVRRDGTVSEFERARFDSAVERAARETEQEVSLDEVYEVALREMQPLLQENPDGQVHAEQVLDAIEVGLMDSGYTDVAKAFIRYRHRRDRRRELGSEYSKAISDINMRYEIRGSVADWLDAVGRTAAGRYIALAELPAKVGHYVSENYLYFPNIVGYGRTVERVSLSVARVLRDSRYLASRHVTQPHRLAVAVSHLVSLYADTARDISGEQCFYGFDRDLGEIVRGLPVEGLGDEEYYQAAQSFVYSLANASVRPSGVGLSVTLGLDTTPEGARFTKALLQAVSRAHDDAVPTLGLHIVFLVSEEANWNPGAPGRELLDRAMDLAASRGGVSFVWDDGYEHAYFSDGSRIAAGDCVSLSIDINAAKLVAEAGSEFHEAFGRLVEAVEAAAERHDRGLAGKGADNFPALSNFGIEEEGWGFQQSLVGQPVLVGVVGLAEAARILDPAREGLESTARLARVMARRMRRRLVLQGERFVLYPAGSRTAARRMHEPDHASMSENYGITSYLPAPSVMPVGYPVESRLLLEGAIYSAFASTGRVQLEYGKPREEIEAGVRGIRDLRAVLGVTARP